MISLRAFASAVLLISFLLATIEAFHLDVNGGAPYEKRWYNERTMSDYIDAIRRGPFSGVPSFRAYVDENRVNS
ncbi:hypothetical protein Q1695_016193 [Nippostrongylus brasiliensis]|nr:hypothetical protein Q1695_016193 [Nippostrongylus brasiliensis]